MDYDELLSATFNEITDAEDARRQLNETLRREKAAEIKEFVFDGCEDIVARRDGAEDIEICSETTMDELLQECGLPSTAAG